jgi:antitoxin component of RelBE/YafQ-DinJ toxin-antitoxin module
MKVPLNVRIDSEIREKLILIAKEENRTISNLVDTLLRQYIAQTESKNRRG